MKYAIIITFCLLQWGITSAQPNTNGTLKKPGTTSLWQVNTPDEYSKTTHSVKSNVLKNTDAENLIIENNAKNIKGPSRPAGRFYNEKVPVKDALMIENSKRKHLGEPPLE